MAVAPTSITLVPTKYAFEFFREDKKRRPLDRHRTSRAIAHWLTKKFRRQARASRRGIALSAPEVIFERAPSLRGTVVHVRGYFSSYAGRPGELTEVRPKKDWGLEAGWL